MKYKVGYKVRIKRDIGYSHFSIKRLEKHNYILTIERVIDDFPTIKYYRVKEIELVAWPSCFIEGLYKEPIPVTSRFEILDLRL